MWAMPYMDKNRHALTNISIMTKLTFSDVIRNLLSMH